MTVYFIVSYDVIDPVGYSAYGPAVRPLLHKHGGELIVAERNATPLEGDARAVNVILKFQSEAAAMSWYNDPEYQPIKKIRIDTTTNTTAFLARSYTSVKTT